MAGLHLLDPFGRFPDEQFPAAAAVSIPDLYQHSNTTYSYIWTKNIKQEQFRDTTPCRSMRIYVEREIQHIQKFLCNQKKNEIQTI